MREKASIVLVGGSGKTGRRLFDQLQALGHNVRIASPSATHAFRWEDRSTWKPVLEGMDRIYIAHHNITDPAAGEQIGELSQLARSCGVNRQVLLSGRADESFCESVEGGIKAAGGDWTILRPAWFMQNFSELFFFEAVLASEIAVPVGDATEPFIDIEDIAAVAATALFDDLHIGQTYELTGPKSLGFAEAADELTKAIGRNIVFKPITMDAYRQSLQAAGLPAEYEYLYSGIADGKLALVTDDVERVLGRKPKPFADYARKAASTGVWNV